MVASSLCPPHLRRIIANGDDFEHLLAIYLVDGSDVLAIPKEDGPKFRAFVDARYAEKAGERRNQAEVQRITAQHRETTQRLERGEISSAEALLISARHNEKAAKSFIAEAMNGVSKIRAAKLLKDDPDQAAAWLLINAVPAEVVDRFRAIADFDLPTMTLEQMKQVLEATESLHRYMPGERSAE